MGRPTKITEEQQKRLSVTIDNGVMVELNKFVEDKCMVKSKLVNKILKEFFKDIKNND